jgi:alpha-tubulin suppressor-like RCC1 family protein
MAQVFEETNAGAGGDTVKTGIINNDNRTSTLQSNWSGASAPSDTVTVIGQFWVDSSTSPPTLKILEDKDSGEDNWVIVPTQGNGQINAATLATDAVETAKIKDLNVTTGKLALLAVDTAQLAAGAVETAKIEDLNVTTGKLALLAVGAAQLAASAVEAAKIATSAVTTDKLAAAAVTAAKIGTSAVTEAKLGTAAVTTAKVADNNITAAKLKATGSVPFVFGKLATDSVPVEIPISALEGGAGLKIAALPTTISRGSHCMAVLTENNEIFMIGQTTSYAVPKTTSRSNAKNWTQVLFNGTPGTITNIYLSSKSGYALDDAGDVWAWGDNTWGQLGLNNTDRRNRADRITAIGSAVAEVIVGYCGNASKDSVFFRTTGGALWAAGANSSGQLGQGNKTQLNIATVITGLSSLAGASLSNSDTKCHAFAWDTSGALWGWGYNGHGQLGDGTTNEQLMPTALSPTGVDVALSVSSYQSNRSHSYCAAGAVIKSCGYNGYYHLGDTTDTQRTSWVTATYGGVNDIVAFESLGVYGCVIARDDAGNLYSCGRNTKGQLGMGDTAIYNVFTAVTMASAATKHRMFAGKDDNGASIYLGTDGELYGCGYNVTGWQAQFDTSDRSTFTQLIRPAGSTIVDFIVAESYRDNRAAVFALDSEGKLYASGELTNVGIGNPAYSSDSPEEYLVLVRVPVF